MAAVAVLLVIASVSVTLLITRSASGGNSPSSGATSPPGGAIASANDQGPIAIITYEPTCQAWLQISNSLTPVQANGWGDRDPNIPATAWSDKQRTQYQAVAASMRQTADQTVNLARQTPNRVVREFYEQFIAYGRAYADSIPTYSAADDHLALANIAASLALDSVCNSITYGSAASQSASATPMTPPSHAAIAGDPADPQRFVSGHGSDCTAVIQRRERLIADTSDWAKLDPNIPGPQWTAEQRSVMDNTARVMTEFAADIESLGKASDNSTLQDFALFTALYVRAYVNSIHSYTSADNYLIVAGTRANNLLVDGCKAAQ